MLERKIPITHNFLSKKQLRILFLLLKYYSAFLTFILLKPLESNGLFGLIAFFGFCQSFQELLSISDYGTKYNIINGEYEKINLLPNFLINFFIIIFVLIFTPTSYRPLGPLLYIILSITYPLNLNNFRNIQEGFIAKVVKITTLSLFIQTLVVGSIYFNFIKPNIELLCFYLLVQNLLPGIVNFNINIFSFKAKIGKFREGVYPSLLMITSYIGVSSIYLYNIPSKSLALFAIAFRVITNLNLTQIYNNTFPSDFRNNKKIRSFKQKIYPITLFSIFIIIILKILITFFYDGFIDLINYPFYISTFFVILLAAQASFINCELIANNKIKKYFKIELISCLMATIFRYFLRDSPLDIMNSILIFYLSTCVLYYYSNNYKIVGKYI